MPKKKKGKRKQRPRKKKSCRLCALLLVICAVAFASIFYGHTLLSVGGKRPSADAARALRGRQGSADSPFQLGGGVAGRPGGGGMAADSERMRLSAAAAAAAAAAALGSRSLLLQRNDHWPSFETSGEDYVTFTAGVLDAPELTVGAWVWLSPADTSKRIKTIVANRASGCTPADSSRYGFSLSVNTWETDDRQLVMEWGAGGGASGSGCRKLLGGLDRAIPYGRWERAVV
jgi:hypothetical protein